MQHDWYDFVSHFWWLIFPLMWMVAAFFRISARHRESQRILDMIQGYTAQGKEPPAALVEMFRAPRRGRRGGYGCDGYGYGYGDAYYIHRMWRRLFFFGFLCAVFAACAWWRYFYPNEIDHRSFGWMIAALITGALALSSLMGLIFRPKLPPPDFGADSTPGPK